MLDYDKWQEIFGTIRKNKLRTFLTALGVFWGIFMLIVLMGAGSGLENGVFSMFGSHARNAMYMWTQRTTLPYMGLPPGRNAQLTNEDIRAIETHFDKEIEYMAPRLWVNSGEIVHNDKKGSFDVRGDCPDMIKIDAVKMLDGRFLNELDMQQRRKVVVIGKRVAETLFDKEEKPVGGSIKIHGTDYLVVGTFQSDRRGEDAEDDEKSIFMPLTTAQQVTNRPNQIGWFVCTIDQRYNISEAQKNISALLKERHKIHPDDPQGVRGNNVQEEVKNLNGLFTGIKLLVWFVGIGSLIAGIIGVGNIMLIIVKDRTKEIGIRKAMGATPASIISMVLLESIFITTIAGYLGLLASTGIVYLMGVAAGTEVQFFYNPQIKLGVGIAAILILVIAGALTGLVPALQASRIKPVEALRDE
ncbi:MAG: ABC transporter permease [Lewinellaceae bacterium]|nr:ABC transporter permease [Saprospiraceae bacterium]MCB9337881.1 ABC transporter permease [Lewinellaceae bacterium]